MPRPPKQKLTLDYDSLKSHTQEVYNQLDELRHKATRDYNKVQTMLTDPTSHVTLEAARNNAMKSLETYFNTKLALLKIHLQIVQAQNKSEGASDEEGGDPHTASSQDMQRWYSELKKMNIEKAKGKD